MAKELGVGILGCGNISTTYFKLAPLFKGIRVVACADIDPAAAEGRGAEFDVTAQSIEALLANPEVDIVVNLTIPEAHFPFRRRSSKLASTSIPKSHSCSRWSRERS